MSYLTILMRLGSWPDLLPRQGWMFDFRPEIQVQDQLIVPDFAGWRASRRVQPSSDAPCSSYSTHRYTDRPDWICDIVEPSNVGLVRNIKPEIYYKLGVASIWQVDRIESTLKLYSADDTGWHLDGVFGGNGRLRAAPLKHIEFNLQGVWSTD